MPNRTIYIADELNDRLKQEDNISGLIQDLLQQHYAGGKGMEINETTVRAAVRRPNPYLCKKCGQIKVAGKCLVCPK